MASKYHVRKDFNSVSEIAELPLPTRSVNKVHWARTSKYKDNICGGGWWGPNQESVEDVISYSKGGWSWGAEKISEMADEISIPILANVKRRLSKGPEGDYLDIHQVYRGNISTAWTKKRRKAGSGPKRFQLLTKLGANCSVKGEVLFWRGVAMAALAKSIVEAGHAVEIIGHSTVQDVFTNGRKRVSSSEVVTVKLKEFGMPLDLENLAVTACLAGFYRYFLFLIRLTHKGLDAAGGLGYDVHELPKIESGSAKQIEVPASIGSKEDVEKFLSEITDKL